MYPFLRFKLFSNNKSPVTNNLIKLPKIQIIKTTNYFLNGELLTLEEAERAAQTGTHVRRVPHVAVVEDAGSDFILYSNITSHSAFEIKNYDNKFTRIKNFKFENWEFIKGINYPIQVKKSDFYLYSEITNNPDIVFLAKNREKLETCTEKGVKKKIVIEVLKNYLESKIEAKNELIAQIYLNKVRITQFGEDTLIASQLGILNPKQSKIFLKHYFAIEDNDKLER
jgi:hypothetical protein